MNIFRKKNTKQQTQIEGIAAKLLTLSQQQSDLEERVHNVEMKTVKGIDTEVLFGMLTELETRL